MEKALILLKDFEESFKDATIVQEGELERNGIAWILYVREAISELEEAIKPKTCSLCIFWDTARPRSHPNYAECNNRKCPLSYIEVHYGFGYKMFVPKDNA